MDAMHFGSILRGVALNAMFQGYRSLQYLPVDKVMSSQYGGHSQYLTIQGLALACLSMLLGSISGIFPDIHAIKSAKRYVMMVAMPVAVVVSSIYWSLLIFFPSLILPTLGAEGAGSSPSTPEAFRLPLHLDLSLHAVPAVSLILDFFLFEEKYSQRDANVVAPFVAAAFAAWYGLWVEHCGRMNNGLYPYPFLTENTQGGRIGIYIGATLFSLLAFRVINRLCTPSINAQY